MYAEGERSGATVDGQEGGAVERGKQDLRTVALEASDPGCERKVAGKDVSRD